MPEYSEIIKTPMDLSVIRSKLEDSNYKSTEDFVEDVRLIFKNCATFHKVCGLALITILFSRYKGYKSLKLVLRKKA